MLKRLPYWVSPVRVGYNYERKERVVLFTVARNRESRSNGVVVEITKADFICSKMEPYEYLAKRALQAAQSKGWVPTEEEKTCL